MVLTKHECPNCGKEVEMLIMSEKKVFFY